MSKWTIYQRTFWMTFALMSVCYGTFLWAAPESPQILIRSLTSSLIHTLEEKRDEIQGNPKAIYPLLEKILSPSVDFQEMSKRVLATHWRQLTDQERKEFIEEFKNLIFRTYANAFSRYKGQFKEEMVGFPPADPVDEGLDDVRVKSVIKQQDGPALSVDYRLIQHKGRWFVYDLTIDGISLVVTYRGQFGASIENSGFPSVLSDLKARNQQ